MCIIYIIVFDIRHRLFRVICFRLVGHLDDFLSLYNGATFFFCIVQIVLILYQLLWESHVFQVSIV